MLQFWASGQVGTILAVQTASRRKRACVSWTTLRMWRFRNQSVKRALQWRTWKIKAILKPANDAPTEKTTQKRMTHNVFACIPGLPMRMESATRVLRSDQCSSCVTSVSSFRPDICYNVYFLAGEFDNPKESSASTTALSLIPVLTMLCLHLIN